MVLENEDFKPVVYKKSRGKKKIYKESLSDVVPAEDEDINVETFLKYAKLTNQSLIKYTNPLFQTPPNNPSRPSELQILPETDRETHLPSKHI